VLHLKSGVTALPAGTVIGHEPPLDDPATFETFLPLLEKHDTAVVALNQRTILMSADAPEEALVLGIGAALHDRGCSCGVKPPVSSSDLAM
jgi:hypothetical protein